MENYIKPEKVIKSYKKEMENYTKLRNGDFRTIKP
jgi:mRNA-degrading endonuclease RelE of RelBE toxin-antitoxin system